MGKQDAYQFDYLDDNRRFADQINGALFHGEQVVKPEELEQEEAQTITSERKRKRKTTVRTIVDKKRLWKGRKLHILVIENQNYVDYHMVLRNMLSESTEYNWQWRQKKRAHEELHDLKEKDEYLSRMKAGERFTPVITVVVYFGTEHPWDGARCLYDLLDIDEELKEYVTNYRLNLYDCQEHDTFEEYQTGLRQVFETVRYAKDKEKLQQIMEENREAYSRIDSETKEMLEVIANVKIPEEFKMIEEGEERYNMCKAFEDMRQEGYEEGMEKGIEKGMEKGIEAGIEKGIIKGIQALIQTCKELGASRETIMEKCMEKFELTGERAEAYMQEYYTG